MKQLQAVEMMLEANALRRGGMTGCAEGGGGFVRFLMNMVVLDIMVAVVVVLMVEVGVEVMVL